MCEIRDFASICPRFFGGVATVLCPTRSRSRAGCFQPELVMAGTTVLRVARWGECLRLLSGQLGRTQTGSKEFFGENRQNDCADRSATSGLLSLSARRFRHQGKSLDVVVCHRVVALRLFATTGREILVAGTSRGRFPPKCG